MSDDGHQQGHRRVVTVASVNYATASQARIPGRRTSTVLIGFSIAAIVLAALAFLLEFIPAAKGVKVYEGGTANGQLMNYYSGIWLGVLEMQAALGVLVYCRHVRKPGRTLRRAWSSRLFCSSFVLIVIFSGLAPTAGFTAMFSFRIFNVMYYSCREGRYGLFGDDCVCDNAYVIKNTGCDFATGAVPGIQLAISTFLLLLSIVDTVIASLILGVTCCCAGAVALGDCDTITVRSIGSNTSGSTDLDQSSLDAADDRETILGT